MIQLAYTQYYQHFTCKIENISELDVHTLQQLENFAAQRSGKLDYSTESLKIPKRIEIQHLQELFNLKGMNVFITEKEPQRQVLADTAVINFGKFKGTKWTDLKDDYLAWLSKNINGDDRQTALDEIERRKKAPPSTKELKELTMIIGFGKYRGQKWNELPKDYLLWIVSNLQGEAKRISEVVLSSLK